MTTEFTLALAQLNPHTGNVPHNLALIKRAATDAAAQGAEVLLTPECVLSGYPAEDLLHKPAFIAQLQAAIDDYLAFSKTTPALRTLLCSPYLSDGKLHNSALLIHNGSVIGRYDKQTLPNYGVFDEQRYFTAGSQPLVFAVNSVHLGVAICEDVWFSAAPAQAKAAGAQVLLVPNGSPYHQGKLAERIATVRANVSAQGLACVYANLVGGQDELLFDGASFALNAAGECVAQAAHCQAELRLYRCDAGGVGPNPSHIVPQAEPLAALYQALVLGVKDYVQKSGFQSVLLGLSGGVDSALVLCLAVDALGADKVKAVMMPSQFTAGISLEDSRAIAQNLGVAYEEIVIEPLVQAFLSALAPSFAGTAKGIAEENIQARVRGTMLMAQSNKFGSLVLTTGNKSEMAVGYCTLYGDMAGGFAAIKDVPKMTVYALCHWRNRAVHHDIPERILSRAPSAELRANQTDQDSLPPYEVLDEIIVRHVEHNESAADIVAAGFDAATVNRVLGLIQRNEYKRRQAPPGTKITPRAFGRDWRQPITNGNRDFAQ